MYGLKDYIPPVAGKFRVTSGEGPRKAKRTANGAMMSSFHHGIDIASSVPGKKVPIRNITTGEVVFTGKAGGYGNAVVVRNPEGYLVQYAHLDKINVKVGDKIPAGGNIGVMGATGNVTGVHLDLIVAKNGKSLKRNGTVLANAPAGITNRAKRKTTTPTRESTPEQSSVLKPSQDTPLLPTSPDQVQGTGLNLFASPKSSDYSQPTNILQGGVGLVVPETQTENRLFGAVADMQLSGGLESIYAEASRAIAKAKDSIDSRPMIQSTNPLRAELSSIFDSIDI